MNNSLVDRARPLGITRILALLLAGLLGTTCAAHGWRAPPGQYTSYHDAMSKTLLARMSAPDDMPMSVRERLANCYADLAVGQLTPAELDVLNAAARGERETSPELNDQVHREMSTIQGGKRGDFSALQPYCPQ